MHRTLPHARRIRPMWTTVALFVILAASFAIRLYGLDWDRGLFFHPDERQILMVVSNLALPKNWGTLLTASSPLNPRFFAYGSLPIYLLRALSWLAALWHPEWATMDHYYLLGRLLSASFDTLTAFAVFVLARKVYGHRVAILATTLVGFTVLHIQLAHFYTVDTLLTALVLLAVCLAVEVARSGRTRDGVVLGVCFGSALATKVSVLPLGVVVMVAWLAAAWPSERDGQSLLSTALAAWSRVRPRLLLTFGVTLLTFLLLEPYAVVDWYHFGQGVGQEIAMAGGWFDFPYTRQYAGTVPYLYQAWQILWFAMGLPLGFVGMGSLVLMGLRLVVSAPSVLGTWPALKAGRLAGWLQGAQSRLVQRSISRGELVMLCWPLIYGVMQGAAYVKFLRYVLPLLPFISIAGSAMLVEGWDRARSRRGARWKRQCAAFAAAALICFVTGSTVFYALAFASVYRQEHPWIQASRWLCQHAPEGSTLTAELWDDPLPARSEPGRGGCSKEYLTVTLDLHAPDTDEKRERLLDGLMASDYVVLSSDRLYAPIVRRSAAYPMSSLYYNQLFAERLGFRLAAAPAVYPQLAGVVFVDNPRAGLQLATPAMLASRDPAGVILNLGRADESFTVYDHPQPLIFQRVTRLTREELEALLTVQ